MKNSFPFADYDFWGYLASGAYLLAVIAVANGVDPFSAKSPSFIVGAVLVAVAYAIGHANAALSSFLLEDQLTARLIGRPVEVMIGTRRPPRLVRFLLPRLTAQLSSDGMARLQRLNGAISEPQDVFNRAYHVARKYPDARDRLDSFRNQYGFCRNAATALLISIPLLLGPAYWLVPLDRLSTLAIVLGLAAIMFLRYLHFYRHFGVEVMNTYLYREAA